jgi:hypothetical protein
MTESFRYALASLVYLVQSLHEPASIAETLWDAFWFFDP